MFRKKPEEPKKTPENTAPAAIGSHGLQINSLKALKLKNTEKGVLSLLDQKQDPFIVVKLQSASQTQAKGKRESRSTTVGTRLKKPILSERDFLFVCMENTITF